MVGAEALRGRVGRRSAGLQLAGPEGVSKTRPMREVGLEPSGFGVVFQVQWEACERECLAGLLFLKSKLFDVFRIHFKGPE